MTEKNLDGWINATLAVGAEVLFIGDNDAMLSNIGDFQPDLLKWPSGIGAAKDRVQAAGLQLGLHMIPSGTSACPWLGREFIWVAQRVYVDIARLHTGVLVVRREGTSPPPHLTHTPRPCMST